MLVEFKLYHTLATLRIAIQWLPLWAINPCSSAISDWFTDWASNGTVEILNYWRAFDSTWIEKLPSPATLLDGCWKKAAFSPASNCLSS